MTFPITRALNGLSRRVQAKRGVRHLHVALEDPHLAKDLGLPHRPRPPKVDRFW